MKKLLLVILLLLTGCAALVDESARRDNLFFLPAPDGKILPVRVSNEWLSRLRTQWTEDSPTIYKTSKVKSADLQWALDFTAFIVEAQGCNTSNFKNITTEQLRKQFNYSGLNFIPVEYNEVWRISSCGIDRDVHVFDTMGIIRVIFKLVPPSKDQ